MRALLRTIAAGLLLSGASFAQAQQTIPLASGVPVNFQIGANQFSNAFVIDVTSQNQLRLELAAVNAADDIDIMLRYGSPFPDRTLSGLSPSAGDLFEFAQYRSQSSSGNELIAIGDYNTFPVRAGRWYVSIVSFAATAASARITATLSTGAAPALPVEVVFDDPAGDCDLSGWTDSTARAPVAGNSGTTLGQQRRNALLEAVRLLGAELRSPVPVRMQACWQDLGTDTGGGVTLASAGPRAIGRRNITFSRAQGSDVETVDLNDRFLPRNYTSFASAPATKLAGARLCGFGGGDCTGPNALYDLRAQFNIKIDGPDALGARSYYYGFTQATTGTALADTDFISVAMHEIAHGLGFIGLVNKTAGSPNIGARLGGFDDIYSANVIRLVGDCEMGSATCTALPFLSGTDADRAAAMTSFTGLRWGDAEASQSPFNPNRDSPAPLNTVTLHAPNPIVSGSTLSHIANAQEAGSLMLAQAVGKPHQLGLALPMMNAVGWSSAPRVAPETVEPFSAQYFDPKRTGHGIDFSRIAGNIYALVFYTYGANGEPEWYIAAGPMVDGVFMPPQNANGDSLVRFRYVPGTNPPQIADATFAGAVRLDFNQPASSPACQDGTSRDLSGRAAVMTWSINNDRNQQWCMQPLIPESIRTTPDFTGGWAAANAADSGWGFSFLNGRVGTNQALFGLLYYPDANGNGRWAFVQQNAFANGTQYPLIERKGYCRTCATPATVLAGVFDDRNAGTITLNLAQPGNAAGNTANFSVTYQTAPGGTFARNGAITQISATRQ
ncbi:MAG TPA: hypothetical protein VND91_03405 [Candidatus Saccharimonadia bacterium]|nr:hypothetical protein [Candidatus Saccharimonadia bacterium]